MRFKFSGTISHPDGTGAPKAYTPAIPTAERSRSRRFITIPYREMAVEIAEQVSCSLFTSEWARARSIRNTGPEMLSAATTVRSGP